MGEQNPTTSELIEELQASTELSQRESEVFVHMAEEIERTDTATEARRAVARGMGIEPSTVDTYYRRALEKIARAVQLQEIVQNQFDAEQIDKTKTKQGEGPVIQCSCGSTDIRHEDMGEHGFALVCKECDATLQAG